MPQPSKGEEVNFEMESSPIDAIPLKSQVQQKEEAASQKPSQLTQASSSSKQRNIKRLALEISQRALKNMLGSNEKRATESEKSEKVSQSESDEVPSDLAVNN